LPALVGAAVQKLRSIQVLRGAAAFGVVLCHSMHLWIGAAGVDVFFVISGFIMGRLMVGRSSTDFLRDRFFRIYPIYWIAVLPWIAIAAAAGHLAPARFATSILLWPIIDGFQRSYLVVGWTLCYEMLFYWALAAAMWTRRPLLPLTGYGVAFVVAWFTGSELFGFIGNPMILEFLAGLVLSRTAPGRPSSALPCIGLAVLVFVLSPAAWLYGFPVNADGLRALERVAWWGIPSVALVYGALQVEPLAARVQPLVALGDASYSLYLFHLPVTMFVQGPAAAALAVAVGLGIHRYVERPLQRLGKRPIRASLSPAVAPMPSSPSS
jgi:exopolysaccharide production protein ExoZ